LKVYIPESFPQEFEQTAKKYGAEVVRVNAPLEIDRGIYSTGEVDHGIKEQSLIINTSKGMILITGCAHPGIIEVIKKAKTTTGREVYLVLGGFHLSSRSAKEIRDIIHTFREMNIQKVAPCHCTGDLAIALFKSAFGRDFIQAGVGRIIDVEERLIKRRVVYGENN
jgi:7,8-dihydropterin-6-yl-methyl-4-(beta-D-ribofuranosyl)aminobenzene 5'-phosphate synthase